MVEQLHRDLYQFTSVRAGRWKDVDNAIEEERPDGTVIVRFQTIPVAETPEAMRELHERYERALASAAYHHLLLVGCYVFDFLAVHPFSDGNGRMSRLLTLLLLHQSGYEVGGFISLERLINESKETYYDALEAAGHGWHDDEHDITPWLNYFLGIVTAACNEFESRVGAVSGSGSKAGQPARPSGHQTSGDGEGRQLETAQNRLVAAGAESARSLSHSCKPNARGRHGRLKGGLTSR